MTDEKNGVRYHLYALPVDVGNRMYAEQCKFSRITARYILVYTMERPEEFPNVEIEEKDFCRLTSEDRAWLWESICVIMREMMEKSRTDASIKMNEMLDRLTDALENERRAIEGAEDDASIG